MYKKKGVVMLERATLLLNAVTVVTMILTGLYVLVAFDDLFSGGAKALIVVGISVYSLKQLDVFSKQGNKN